jgi:hypothetical protein
MKLFSLLDVQYAQFANSIKNYLSKTLSSTKDVFGNNTVFGQLINVLTGAVQNIMLYIEDALVEQNKYTAQRKKSIYGLAALSGYTPSYGKACGVQLKLSFVPTNTKYFNIIINNHERLTCTQNGLQYNLILPQESILMSIEHDNSSKFLYAVQGKFENQQFVSSGGALYTQNFKFLGNMDTDYMTVKVNNEIWEYCPSLYDMVPDGKQYTYKVSNVNGIDLIFGNDVYGRSLEEGDRIEVSYLVHDGEVGNIDSLKETYFIFDNELKDVTGEVIDGNSVFNVTFAVKDPVTSGTNSESIDQVRQMIGLNSRALVLASPDNYKNLIDKFSFCGYNRTWTDRGSMMVNSLILKNYKQLLKNGQDYFNLSESDFILTDQQKQSIINHIDKNGCQLAGVTYNIYNPEICKYMMYIYVTLKDKSYDKIYINEQIRSLVGDFFGNVNSDIFIPKSDIVHLIKSNVDSVDSVDVYFLSERNETALINRTYVNTTHKYNYNTGTYVTKKENVYLYDGENPNLGLDEHGNISLSDNYSFPVLMGGWSYLNAEEQLVAVTDPLIITFK